MISVRHAVTFSIDNHDLDSDGSLLKESLLEVLVKPPDNVDLSLKAFDTSCKAPLSNKPVSVPPNPGALHEGYHS